MAERTFELPDELRQLIEHVARLSPTGQEAARDDWLAAILTSCARENVNRARVFNGASHAGESYVELSSAAGHTVRLDGPLVPSETGRQHATEEWIYGFALQVARERAVLRTELEETNRGVVALYAEIDARTAAEQAATAAAQDVVHQWQATFDTVDEAILVSDARGQVARANRAATALLDEELLGKNVRELMRNRLRLTPTPNLAAKVPGMLVPEPLRGRRLRLYADPILEQNHWRGAVVRIHDVTQELHMQQELEARAQRLLTVDRRKDEYIAMLGHELRNPIATMDGAVKLLRETLPDEETSRLSHVLDVLDRHGRNVRRLLDDLLNVSRIKQGKVVLRKRHVDLSQIARDCARDVVPLIHHHEHRLEVRVPDEAIVVDGDATRLEQVISNLLDNAIKYTPRGGDIRLTLEASETEAVLRVHDSGIGIEPEQLQSAFEAFVQFEVSHDRAVGGMGLGLSLVKALVELHDGHVSARSPGRDEGSTFEVRVPRVAREPLAESQQANQTRDVSGLLLLVEDNEDLRELTASRLRRRGFEVVEAGDCDAALERAAETPPDVLVTDIGLPGRDGFELSRRLTACLETSGMIRVALSGYGPPEDPARRQAFDAYLVKPLDVDELVRVVQERSH